MIRSLPEWLLRWPWLSLLLVAAAIHAPGSLTLPLLDRDEPRFSQATAEMMERGEWAIPYFNEQYRFDKPPLTYWWMRLHYAAFGKTEFAARLHSVLATAGIALGIFAFGRRLFSPGVAWMAAFAWLTCFQVFQHGRVAVADMPMVAAVFFASWALYELLREAPRQPRLWFWVLWVSLGLGFLAKGPIAWAVPALGALLFRFAFWRKPLPWRQLRLGPGMAVALGMVAAWGIPALAKTQGLFWQVGMGEHVVQRGMSAFNDRTFVPFFYFLTAAVSLLPWFGLLGHRLRTARADWGREAAFLVSMALAPYAIFFFYSTQLPHYVLPAFPALLLWLMAGEEAERRKGAFERAWFHASNGLFAVVGLGGAAYVWSLGSPRRELAGAFISVFLILTTLAAIGYAYRWRLWAAMLALTLVLGALSLRMGDHARAVSPVIPLAELLEGLPEETLFVARGFQEPSLVFYTGRRWEFPPDDADLAARLVTEDAARTVYVWQEGRVAADKLLRDRTLEIPVSADSGLADLAARTHEVHTVDGLNLAQGKWTRLRIAIPR